MRQGSERLWTGGDTHNLRIGSGGFGQCVLRNEVTPFADGRQSHIEPGSPRGASATHAECKEFIIEKELPLRIKVYEAYVAFSRANKGKILFPMEKGQPLPAFSVSDLSPLTSRLCSPRGARQCHPERDGGSPPHGAA